MSISVQMRLHIGVPALAVQMHKVFKTESDEPWLPVAPMEQSGYAVLKSFCISHSLLHCLRNIEFLHALALYVDARESHHVGHISE